METRHNPLVNPSLFFTLAFFGLLSSQVVINEIDSDTPGTDTREFIELYDGGSGGTPLEGLSLVFFNGNGDVSYSSFDLDGFSTNSAGYFVIGNPDVTEAGLNFPAGVLQNGPDAVAIYRGDASDFPNGAAISTDNLIDAVVYGTNDPEDGELLALLNAGQRQIDEQGGGDKDAHSLQRFPNGSGGPRNTVSFSVKLPTPGRSNGGEAAVSLEIHDVQGNGLTSPYVGQSVTMSQNIVTGVTSNGFYVQTPDARQDGDPETSQGVYIYSETAPAVRPGDLVDVTGEVKEFNGETEILPSGDATILSSNLLLPASILFDETLPYPDPNWTETALERFEGMRVHLYVGMICGPSDSYGEAWIAAGSSRTFREPGILFPGRTGLPVWDGNPERLALDPDGLGLSIPPLFAGARIDSLAGILTYRFGNYKIQPTLLSLSEYEYFSPVRARAAGEYTIGTLNLHQLMDDIDDPNIDEEVADVDGYQQRLKKLSRYIREVLVGPDILAVQEAENEAVLQTLTEQIQNDDPDMRYTPFLREGADVSGIDVGFLTAATIGIDSVVQTGKTTVFEFQGASYLLHDRPPLLLYYHIHAAENDRGVVMNVHLRSMLGIEDTDSLRIRQKRYAQAVDVARTIQTLQQLDPTIRLAVTGDFNAFEFTDGFVDVLGQITGSPDPDGALIACTPVVDPPLINQVLSISDGERYSYVFEGTAQTLDHMLTSSNLAPDVREVRFGRGNADAPSFLERDESSPLRVSDHDGLVMFILPKSQDIVHGEGTDIPFEFTLYGNYPNPFNPSTRIDFSVPRDGEAVVTIHNMLGQRIVTLLSGFIHAGSHSLNWTGKDESGREVPGGVYILHLRTGQGSRTRKMVLQK